MVEKDMVINMKEEIQQKLAELEKIYDMKVLFAVEAGSRAWGIPSEKSDYDVRFVYIHRPEWYLEIDPPGVGSKRDVIECPISEALDLSGWEVTKALKLFRKSSPALLEWLASDHFYLQEAWFVEELQGLVEEVFSLKASFFHYFKMAKGNYHSLKKSDKKKVKLFLNVLRPLLACLAITQHQNVPPVPLMKLIDKVPLPESVLKDIEELIKLKRAGEVFVEEKDLNEMVLFFDQMIKSLEESGVQLKDHTSDLTSSLNALFQKTLFKIW